jgi:hypothetical protein
MARSVKFISISLQNMKTNHEPITKTLNCSNEMCPGSSFLLLKFFFGCLRGPDKSSEAQSRVKILHSTSKFKNCDMQQELRIGADLAAGASG